MDKQRVKLSIAERSYQLEIEPEMEESIRAAVDSINARILEARNRYTNVDMRDILSIVLLEEESRLIGLERRNAGELGELEKEIGALDRQLGEYLYGR